MCHTSSSITPRSVWLDNTGRSCPGGSDRMEGVLGSASGLARNAVGTLNGRMLGCLQSMVRQGEMNEGNLSAGNCSQRCCRCCSNGLLVGSLLLLEQHLEQRRHIRQCALCMASCLDHVQPHLPPHPPRPIPPLTHTSGLCIAPVPGSAMTR